MTCALILKDADAELTCGLPAVYREECDDRAELFSGVRILLADIHRILFGHEKFCSRRNRDPSHLSNFQCRSSDDLRIHRSVRSEKKSGKLVRLLFRQEIAALFL